MQNSDIQTRPCPICPVCGSQGSVLYRGLSDRIFYVSGSWDMKKCCNTGCGSLWLDPMPLEADLPKLYASYYTHNDSPAYAGNPIRVALARVGAAYLHSKYGYESGLSRWANALLSMLPRLHPALKDNLEASVFHLDAKPGGCLLEVGCGSGATLESMARRGWSVTGLDFDQEAVNNARSKGLDVRHGQLSAQKFADESFDAVIMGHVIEHVPSPAKLLSECQRVLKKNGTLVVLTPNANAYGHRRYGYHWRALDPPRHLHLFTSKSLASIARSVGYAAVETFTSMHGFVYHDLASAELVAGKSHVMTGRVAPFRHILSHIKALGLGWLHMVSRDRGEEAVLVCRK